MLNEFLLRDLKLDFNYFKKNNRIKHFNSVPKEIMVDCVVTTQLWIWRSEIISIYINFRNRHHCDDVPSAPRLQLWTQMLTAAFTKILRRKLALAMIDNATAIFVFGGRRYWNHVACHFTARIAAKKYGVMMTRLMKAFVFIHEYVVRVPWAFVPFYRTKSLPQ